jgi:putative copper resistance protein D
VAAGLVTCVTAGLLAASAYHAGAALPTRRWPEELAAALLLASIVATSHATGRVDDRAWLLGVSALHQAGAAAWIGGLPYFLIVLAATLANPLRAAIAQRYSRICVLAVAAILLSACAKYAAYLGVLAATYGTAYGLMTTTKVLLFCALLAFGVGNFWAVRRLAESAAARRRTRLFVEVELAVGVTVFFLAGSLTSLPPAIDLPHDRVPWDTIVERVLIPKAPRLTSPSHSELWYETEQVRLNALAAVAREEAPRAFVPGAGIVYPRSAADIAWSEYNHNWSGVFVLAIGVLAMLARLPGMRWARHWPMMCVALGIFIAIRADPESWPLGSTGFLEAFREPGVVQHRLMTLLVIVFGLFEWRVRIGGLATTRAVYVFPLSNILGGILLLTHSHVLENIQEALLVEMSHIPIGVLALVAGCARWLELRADSPLRERAGYVWPCAFSVVGLVLMFYRES